MRVLGAPPSWDAPVQRCWAGRAGKALVTYHYMTLYDIFITEQSPYLIKVIKERNRSGAILIAVLAVMSFVLLMGGYISARVVRSKA